MLTEIGKLHEKVAWMDMTPGCVIVGSGTSRAFNTGDWRVETPVLREADCRQCFLCAAACPDSAVRVVDGQRVELDLNHCKGCGICARVCPFSAIQIKEGA